MRYTYSAICPKHGYHIGSDCPKCVEEPINEAFMTNRDQLYKFHSLALGIKIESKSQWKRELKSRGLTDDFNQGKLEIGIHKKPKLNHEEIKNNIRDEMKSRGLYSREKLFLKEARRIRI